MIELSMFKFISVDSMICADNVVDRLRDGAWFKLIVDNYEEEINEVFGFAERELIILKIIEASFTELGIIVTSASDGEMAEAVYDLESSLNVDFMIHMRNSILESDAFLALREWLRGGDYFKLNNVKFTLLDILDEVEFLEKYFKHVKGAKREVSSEDGFDLLDEFNRCCKECVKEF